MKQTAAAMMVAWVLAIPAFAAGEMKHGHMETSDGINIHYIEQGEGVAGRTGAWLYGQRRRQLVFQWKSPRPW